MCKNIETNYMLKLGGLEYKAYEAQCEALRLKRKPELIQARKNRQEKIILSMIDAILDAEFAEYQAKLNEQIEKVNDALERNKTGQRDFCTVDGCRKIAFRKNCVEREKGHLGEDLH